MSFGDLGKGLYFGYSALLSMLKKIIAILLLSIISLRGLSHVDIAWTDHQDNIHFRYLIGWGEFEIAPKARIVLKLAAQLAKERRYDEHIFIDFKHDYTLCLRPNYAIGYGEFDYWNDPTKGKLIKRTTHGLKLVIQDKDVNVTRILNLLNAAMINRDVIKRDQIQYVVDLRMTNNGVQQFDTLYSISPNIIKKYCNSVDTTVDRLLASKTYSGMWWTEEKPVMYYFQHGKYHLYTSKEEEGSKKILEKDVLTITKVHEIFGSKNEGFFVFKNDSVFFFIDYWKDSAIGPFKVDSIMSGRSPVSKYYCERLPMKRFFLYFDEYGPYRKAMFIPDSNILVSNYLDVENEFIKSFHGNEDDEKNGVNLKLVLASILAISFLLNLVLWTRQKRNGPNVRT